MIPAIQKSVNVALKAFSMIYLSEDYSWKLAKMAELANSEMFVNVH